MKDNAHNVDAIEQLVVWLNSLPDDDVNGMVAIIESPYSNNIVFNKRSPQHDQPIHAMEREACSN